MGDLEAQAWSGGRMYQDFFLETFLGSEHLEMMLTMDPWTSAKSWCVEEIGNKPWKEPRLGTHRAVKSKQGGSIPGRKLLSPPS